MDIRSAMAAEIAEQIGAVVLAQHCDCGWPLMEKADQGMPFCWGCVTDRRSAMNGQARLLKAKLADQGVVIEHAREWTPTPPTDDSDEPCWPGGQGTPL